MELDEQSKRAVREIGMAINRAIEKSTAVAEAVQRLRELGYEPNLTLKLEIALQEIENRVNGSVGVADAADFAEDIELELTDEDVRTLRRMKIKIE
jgi:hypothetical protein